VKTILTELFTIKFNFESTFQMLISKFQRGRAQANKIKALTLKASRAYKAKAFVSFVKRDSHK
jgi:hypothetical protein